MSVLGSVWTLPVSFFQEAQLTSSPTAAASPPDQTNQTPAQAPAQRQSSTDASISRWSDGATCQACGIGINSSGFQSAAEQRAHFRTDWHRFNVKRRISKQAPVSEEQFEQMLAEESEMSSISGSSSSSEEEEDEVGAGPNPARKQRGSSLPPQAMFVGPDGKPFCVWKSLLERDHVKQGEVLTDAQLLAELLKLRQGTGLFVVMLLRGGHFAAGVFKAKSSTSAKASTSEVFEVVAHKTFHRYVVRAKGGGKQSSQDATGKIAKSAGSALRRYNEQALDRDIQELLLSWRPHLDAADRVFVQAPSSNAKSVFMSAAEVAAATGASAGSSGAAMLPPAGQATRSTLLNPHDPRVRRIPFATQRPTFSEARRVLGLLSSVFEPAAAQLAAQQAAAEAVVAAAQQRAERAQQKELAKQQKAAQAAKQAAAGAQAVAAAAEAVAAKPEVREPELHAASRTGDAEAVSRLLSSGADPSARDARGRTAYAVSSTKEVRDAFRRFMAAEPERWDYSASGIPSALTEELEAAQAAKKAEKKARQKAKDAERKVGSEERKKEKEAAAKLAMEEEIAQAAAEAAALSAKMSNPGPKKGGKVGGGASTSGQGGGSKGGKGGKAPPATAPPTLEEMAKRREMMAAAAEARMKSLQSAMSQQKLY